MTDPTLLGLGQLTTFRAAVGSHMMVSQSTNENVARGLGWLYVRTYICVFLLADMVLVVFVTIACHLLLFCPKIEGQQGGNQKRKPIIPRARHNKS